MMMARKSTPDRPELSAASLEALRAVLQECLAHTSETSSLQSVLQQIAVEARSRKMHAEQLLIALKDVWYGLPQIKLAPEGEEQNRLLQRVVTMCIREYY